MRRSVLCECDSGAECVDGGDDAEHVYSEKVEGVGRRLDEFSVTVEGVDEEPGSGVRRCWSWW